MYWLTDFTDVLLTFYDVFKDDKQKARHWIYWSKLIYKLGEALYSLSEQLCEV